MAADHTDPLTQDQRTQLSALAGQLAPAQRLQAIGLLAGNAGESTPVTAVAPVAVAETPSLPFAIYYGTESGNAETLADEAKKRLTAAGLAPKIRNLADCKPSEFAANEHLVVIVSTWGDGDPPDAVVDFHAALMGAQSADLDLKGTRFSVCALGDTSYEKFCETGKQVDARLEELGGTRLADREDCDVDYDASFDAWIERVIAAVQLDLPDRQANSSTVATGQVLPVAGAPTASATTGAAVASSSVYNKKNPFPAPLAESILLNGTGSAKETLHLELSLKGSGLSYQPGDALAVVPRNHDDVVDELLEVAGLAGKSEVSVQDEVKPLREALCADLDCTALSRNILKKWNEIVESDKLAALLDQPGELKNYLPGRQIVDMLADFPAKDLSAERLASVLRKLPPRLYSIASSQLAHPEEVHLTVAAVRYHAHGRDRKGVASTFLADDVKAGDTVSVYLHHNKNFKLPADPGAPIIMVGPGTGIAPFRAFLEERAATSSEGAAWLFFGDQHYTTDFLYQLELQQFLDDGTLDRLDLAFSRDQAQKVYVQHRMLENGADIFQWLEQGAYFYVCGDAERMAGDVHDALLEIITTYGNRTAESAEAYLARLKKLRRYQRDVY